MKSKITNTAMSLIALAALPMKVLSAPVSAQASGGPFANKSVTVSTMEQGGTGYYPKPFTNLNATITAQSTTTDDSTSTRVSMMTVYSTMTGYSTITDDTVTTSNVISETAQADHLTTIASSTSAHYSMITSYSTITGYLTITGDPATTTNIITATTPDWNTTIAPYQTTSVTANVTNSTILDPAAGVPAFVFVITNPEGVPSCQRCEGTTTEERDALCLKRLQRDICESDDGGYDHKCGLTMQVAMMWALRNAWKLKSAWGKWSITAYGDAFPAPPTFGPKRPPPPPPPPPAERPPRPPHSDSYEEGYDITEFHRGSYKWYPEGFPFNKAIQYWSNIVSTFDNSIRAPPQKYLDMIRDLKQQKAECDRDEGTGGDQTETATATGTGVPNGESPQASNSYQGPQQSTPVATESGSPSTPSEETVWVTETATNSIYSTIEVSAVSAPTSSSEWITAATSTITETAPPVVATASIVYVTAPPVAATPSIVYVTATPVIATPSIIYVTPTPVVFVTASPITATPTAPTWQSPSQTDEDYGPQASCNTWDIHGEWHFMNELRMELMVEVYAIANWTPDTHRDLTGQDDPSKPTDVLYWLHKELRGCEVSPAKSPDRRSGVDENGDPFTFLEIITLARKGCVERAIRSAGGPEVQCVHRGKKTWDELRGGWVPFTSYDDLVYDYSDGWLPQVDIGEDGTGDLDYE